MFDDEVGNWDAGTAEVRLCKLSSSSALAIGNGLSIPVIFWRKTKHPGVKCDPDPLGWRELGWFSKDGPDSPKAEGGQGLWTALDLSLWKGQHSTESHKLCWSETECTYYIISNQIISYHIILYHIHIYILVLVLILYVVRRLGSLRVSSPHDFPCITGLRDFPLKVIP